MGQKSCLQLGGDWWSTWLMSVGKKMAEQEHALAEPGSQLRR